MNKYMNVFHFMSYEPTVSEVISNKCQSKTPTHSEYLLITAARHPKPTKIEGK